MFSIFKTGYSVGVHGCSAEYFTAIIIDAKKNKWQYVRFNGLYGAEERVSEVLKGAGYIGHYTPTDWGKISRKDAKGSISEHEAIEEVKKIIEA